MLSASDNSLCYSSQHQTELTKRNEHVVARRPALLGADIWTPIHRRCCFATRSMHQCPPYTRNIIPKKYADSTSRSVELRLPVECIVQRRRDESVKWNLTQVLARWWNKDKEN